MQSINFHPNDPMKLRLMHAFGKDALTALCQLASIRTQWDNESEQAFNGYVDIAGVEDILLYMTLVLDTLRCITQAGWSEERAERVPRSVADTIRHRAIRHSHGSLGDLTQYFALAHHGALEVVVGVDCPATGPLDFQKVRMTSEFLAVLLPRVSELAETCHEYDNGIFWQDLHDLVACAEVGSEMLDLLNSPGRDANEPVPPFVLLGLGRCLRDRRFQASSRNVVEDIVVDAFEAAATVAIGKYARVVDCFALLVHQGVITGADKQKRFGLCVEMLDAAEDRDGIVGRSDGKSKLWHVCPNEFRVV